MEIKIEPAKKEDARRLLDIYTPYILNTAITFEYTIPTVEELSLIHILCKEAKSLIDKNTIDLTILDVNLPDGNGFEFCKWLKARYNIPVVFLSARDLEDDVLSGYELGADDYRCV